MSRSPSLPDRPRLDLDPEMSDAERLDAMRRHFERIVQVNEELDEQLGQNVAEDKPLALKALYTLTTEAHVRKVAKDEKERKMITYYRKKCRKRIEAAYGQAASF